MGEIADTLRSTLRQLAQADARLYRGLAQELSDGATAVKEVKKAKKESDAEKTEKPEAKKPEAEAPKPAAKPTAKKAAKETPAQ
jgi:hypothetical protein